MRLTDGLAWSGLPLAAFSVSSHPPLQGRPGGLRWIASMCRTPQPPPMTDVADAEPFLARVDHGRWIVDCPCRAASMIWLEELVTWCAACANRHCGGQWQPVALPATARRIEEILLARPDAANRNWFPGETVDDLLAENAEHGHEVTA